MDVKDTYQSLRPQKQKKQKRRLILQSPLLFFLLSLIVTVGHAVEADRALQVFHWAAYS
jgi:hypothetical protein